MGQTHDIDRNQWEAFFNEVARTERNRHVWLEVESPELGVQRVADEQAFGGISLDRRGGDDIDLVLQGGSADNAFEHRVAHAEKVYALEGDDGRLNCLDIETGPTHTRLLFD